MLNRQMTVGDPTQRDDQPSESKRRLVIPIAVALTVWGIFLAIGAATQFGGFNPNRGYVVAGFFGVFLGVWLLMLWLNAGRRRN